MLCFRYASNTSVDQKIQYEDLCRCVPPELYIECLSNVLTTLWGRSRVVVMVTSRVVVMVASRVLLSW